MLVVVPTASDAEAATREASLADMAISRMEAPISSEPVATVATLADTWWAADATAFAWLDVASAVPPIWIEVADSLPEEAVIWVAAPVMACTVAAMVSTARSRARPMRPTSSARVSPTLLVRSPSATRPSTSTVRRSGRVIPRTTQNASSRAATRQPSATAIIWRCVLA